MELEPVDLSEWGELLPETGVEVFHTPTALSVIDDHSAGDLHLLAGYRGDRAVALFPAVERDRSLGTAVLSPPPSLSVPRLGPVLMPASPKRSKRERLNHRFVQAVVDYFDLHDRRSVFRAVCPTAFRDPRPYDWEQFDVDNRFTYLIDVDRDPDAIMDSFSGSLRREVRRARDVGVSVSVEGPDAARTIYDRTRRRYEDTDAEFAVPWEYVADLLDALGDRARSYVARAPDGSFLSGIIALFGPDTAYYWQGGGRATYDGRSVNGLVHWTIIEDLVTEESLESIDRYDLVGANERRLSEYKAKFGGDLASYYVVESGGVAMDVAKGVYRLLEGRSP